MSFFEKLKKIVKKNNSLLCLGLDTDLKKIYQIFKRKISQYDFNKKVIEKTADLICAYKINSAFYEAEGEKGILDLKKTCHFIKKNYPQIPVIIDGKRGDIDNTNKGYIKFIFNYLKADAVTVNPYLGAESLKPFLFLKDKGIFILCKTSNPGAGEFQDLNLFSEGDGHQKIFIPLYLKVAKNVALFWNKNKNCGLIIGATYPKQLKKIREVVGEDFWFLLPGIGAQGGDLGQSLKNGLNRQKQGLIINISRGIIFASSNFTKIRMMAKKYQQEINRLRV